ncbi:putative holliday junction resolvase [Marinitoga hydrogenitolerans DSM 16785]|uniref:Putative pre-16S rRNA nuclease n=1 Tax=Marinitoga hydrogenitolerans (strain DSM 16785 / JCM 12826 / AT1271) TaxID=1122195 RepID=A0A1M5A8V4_MARH1|nr:Holliday junction resolvase RuvX [Marinitoga hydrogenitolerans]SHF26708.1 putative holliday junction resolvase [Marinitoga hydrogenitolerans DSM 16785]
MNYIGLDYGLSKTGIAISNSILKIATIKGTVNTNKLLSTLKNEIYTEGDAFVVGLPISMSGRFSKQTFETIDFSLKLKNLFKSDIFLIDERLTTQQSYSMTKNFLNSKKAKKAKDQNSALLILQKFLDNPKLGIKLEAEDVYSINNIDSNSILINNIIIKNSSIYNKADIYTKNPFVFWWYFKRNKKSTTLLEDLKEEYDVLISKSSFSIKYKKLIKIN